MGSGPGSSVESCPWCGQTFKGCSVPPGEAQAVLAKAEAKSKAIRVLSEALSRQVSRCSRTPVRASASALIETSLTFRRTETPQHR